MDFADFFEIDRLSEHDEEQLIESAMQLQQVMLLYEAGIREIKTKLDILSDESRISGKASPIDSIKSRIKTPRSIIGKLKRRGYPISLQSMMENLNDIGGIRVICPFIEDIYTVADMLMRQDDLTLIEKKDYIKNPKPNGYRSLHLMSCSCARSRWTSGRVWSTSCATRRMWKSRRTFRTTSRRART